MNDESKKDSDIHHSSFRIHHSEVLQHLERLVDKSLVTVQERPRAPRYGMLEMVREYALECMERDGESAEVRTRHADYFYALGIEARDGIWAGKSAEWLDRIAEEHDNFRAALQWSLETDDALMDVAPQMPTEVGATENEGCVAPTSSRPDPPRNILDAAISGDIIRRVPLIASPTIRLHGGYLQ